jgi:hypothetical protein
MLVIFPVEVRATGAVVHDSRIVAHDARLNTHFFGQGTMRALIRALAADDRRRMEEKNEDAEQTSKHDWKEKTG